jgi:hypothetical protein
MWRVECRNRQGNQPQVIRDNLEKEWVDNTEGCCLRASIRSNTLETCRMKALEPRKDAVVGSLCRFMESLVCG